ncbi:unnamed protein product, partial [Penicillium discolor]
AARAERAHGVALTVPTVVIAHHADRGRVGCPDRERHALLVSLRAGMGSQRLPQPFVTAFGDQMKVQVAEGRRVTVRVACDALLLAAVARRETVGERRSGDVDRLGEGVEPDVVVIGPGPDAAREQVLHLVALTQGHAPACGVEMDRRLAHRVRVDVRDDDERVRPPGSGEGGVEMLAEHEDGVIVAPVQLEVAQLPQRRMRRADLVQLPQERSQRLPALLGARPVAELVLVLLVVDVLLGTRAGHVLDEFVSRIHAVHRTRGGGDAGADAVGRASAELEVLGEDVVRVDEEVRAHVVGRLVGDRREELLELRLGVAPCEVAVALLEAHRGERAHHRRSGERLGQEDHVGIRLVHRRDQPLPEPERLGVRVVHAEDPYTLRHPVPDDPEHLGGDPLRVVVEVQRVDVLVLLRRVLGVRDRAVGEGGEPLRVVAHPGVVGGGLQREVEGDLQSLLPRGPHEGAEVLRSAEVRVDRIVPALRRSDGVRRARVPGLGDEGVVATLAVGRADGMHGDEVDHVEAHPGDLGQALRCSTERAAADRSVLEAAGSLRPGEELVPGADSGTGALYTEELLRGGRTERRDGTVAEDRREIGVHGPCGGDDGVAGPEFLRPGPEARALRCGAVLLGSRPLQELGSEGGHHRHVHTGGDLHVRGVRPGGEVVGERLEAISPEALRIEGDLRLPAIGAVGERRQPVQTLFAGR